MRRDIARRAASPRIAGAAAAGLVMLSAGTAHAATVSLSPPSGGSREVSLSYVAGPEEANRVQVQPPGADLFWTVADTGAVIHPGPGCSSVDAHTARCLRPPDWINHVDVELGDLDDEVTLVSLGRVIPPGMEASGGTGNDRLTGVGSGGKLNGGPGDDRLVGGDGYAAELDGGPDDDVVFGAAAVTYPAVLDGGGGRDRLYGGPGDETLSDGDRDGAVGDAAPGPDVLDGGGGINGVSYGRRIAPVIVDLTREGGQGAPGEGDSLRRVRSIGGGRGDDRLAGNDSANSISGNRGRDTLIGRGGNDYLFGGDDAIICGAGHRDLVQNPHVGDELHSSCEAVTGYDGWPSPAYPTVGRDMSLRYRVTCQRELGTDEVLPCSGAILLTQPDHPRGRLARGDFPEGVWFHRRVDLAVTPLGRQLTSSRRGVRATMTLRRNRSIMRWTILLKRPR